MTIVDPAIDEYLRRLYDDGDPVRRAMEDLAAHALPWPAPRAGARSTARRATACPRGPPAAPLGRSPAVRRSRPPLAGAGRRPPARGGPPAGARAAAPRLPSSRPPFPVARD